MKRYKRSYRWLGLVFLLGWSVSCTAVMEPQSTPTPAPTETPTPTPLPTPTPFYLSIYPTQPQVPGLPTYAKWGKYTVGVTSIAFSNTDEVSTILWYPVKKNRMPETAGAPFPLIIMSPGAMTSGADYDYLLSHLASYGFTVLSWDPHESSTDMYTWLGNRSLAMKLLTSFADKINSPGGQLAGLIDMKRIGVIGYSLGGWTALTQAGAQMDFQWCEAHPDLINQDQEITCQVLVQKEQDIAASLGLDSVPSGLWPTMNDPRVVAVVAMAPVGKLWGADYEGIVGIKVPILIMTGSKDQVLKPELGALPIYDHLGSPKKSLVVFEGKDHFAFFGWDEDAIVIKQVVTAYLLAELKGDAEAAKALAPTSVTFPGVRYETTEFNPDP